MLTLLMRGGVEVPEAIHQAGILTQYAVQVRYPGGGEDVTRDEYVRALARAEEVVLWVEQVLGDSPPGAV